MEQARREAARLLDRALDGGAEGAEVLLVDQRGLQMSVDRQQIHDDRAVSDRTLSVRVWLDGGREGRVAGPRTKANAIVAEALKKAASAARGGSKGPVGRVAAEGVASDIADRRFADLDRADRVDALLSAERAVFDFDDALQPSGLSYAESHELRTFINSRGVAQQEAGTRFRLQGSVRDAVTDLQLHEVLEDRSFSTIASVPFTVSLARRLVELRDASATLSGPTRAVLTPWATAQIIRVLAPHFRRSELDRGSSFLARARSGGDLSLSSMLHVIDDGLLSGGLRSSSFDDRGVAPVPLTLVRDGRVEGWYLGVDEARRLGARPTGHERGGFLHSSNIIVRAGLRSINALLAEQTVPVLVIDHLRGLDAGLDLLSGELRCEASGRVVQPRNKTEGFMPHIELTGSLIDVLSQVLDLASDTDRYRHIDAAALLVDGFSVRDLSAER